MIAGLCGGAILWNIVGSHAGVWDRLHFETEAHNVRRVLNRQMFVVVVLTFAAIMLSYLIPAPFAEIFTVLTIVGGIIFWSYMGAQIVTAWRAMKARQ